MPLYDMHLRETNVESIDRLVRVDYIEQYTPCIA
jgi:hypothetical protein